MNTIYFRVCPRGTQLSKNMISRTFGICTFAVGLTFSTFLSGKCIAETIRYLPAKDLAAFDVFISGDRKGDRSKYFDLRDGILHLPGSGPGFLITKQSFKSYTLKVEYWWLSNKADRNSGIFVNTVRKGNLFTALEVDLPRPDDGLSGRVWLFGKSAKKQLKVDGKVISKGGIGPIEDANRENPIGEWNVLEILCQNEKFQVKLNGYVTVNGTNPAPNAGTIMIQSGPGRIEFRLMEVTDFDQ